MIPKTHKVLEQCIEDGLAYGWNKAHKHTDTPTAEQIQQSQLEQIFNEIYEWFDMRQYDVY